ncbi:MAG TPA: NBR1-Ig-like domain-containing protein [Anaerolineales bacterium]|nr:NBR1-Ig-like domain-containing protein [Anaerolineales bacterium]
MKTKVQAASTLLLIALVLSFIPAAALTTTAFAAQTCSDWAQFVADVTVPDGTRYDPGATFTKTWRLRNIGTCTWTTSYTMIFDSGTQMGTTASVPFGTSVAPGATIDLPVNMTAPSSAGHYIGYWKFKNASGTPFGIGYNANRDWWVEINVNGTPTTGVAYDFTANAGSATWSSGAGGLSFPGTDGDAKGFALKLDKPNFESGAVASQPGLLFSPQQITNGFIQASYPAFTVQSGDRFQATVGCQAGATSCYVAYRLDYEANGAIRTFWTFREKFEGLTYNANLNLGPLAGQSVKFILYISAYGSPVGDRALWGNPVIARSGVVVTPAVTGTPPTPTLTNTPGPVTVTVPPSACDRAQFVADVNVPDGTVMAPGATFTKTWRLKNVGTCAWSTSYQLVYFSGEQMGAPASAAFPQNVPVGQTVNISINMTAPSTAGSYRGYWMFKNANGALFGIGPQANKPWWVDIKVSGTGVTPGATTPAPTANIAYDFATNACAGTWFSGAGQLLCPGTDGDAKGFVLKVSNPKLENGTTDTRPGILTFPQNVSYGSPDGYIQGFFPAFRVQNGDRFRSIINCEYGATNCYVAFSLDYQTGTDPIKSIGRPFPFGERYEGNYFAADVDLSFLAGKDVKFILTVRAAGTAVGDRALWVGPIIYRAGATSTTPVATTAVATTPVSTTPTTPVATTAVATTAVATTAVATTAVATTAVATTAVATTPVTPAASAFQDAKYNFKFTLPSGAAIVSQTDNLGRVSLPIVTGGTNLLEKYIQINVEENKSPCTSPAVDGTPTSTENVTINNVQFVKTTGQGAAAGNRYDWTAYATTSNNACISLAFILHSANPGNYATQPPVFDSAKESEVIGTTIATYSKMSQ